MNIWIAMLVYNAAVLAALAALVLKNPRFATRGLPPEIKALIPALTPSEKRGAILWRLPVLAVMLLGPLGYVLWFELTTPSDFWALWGQGFALLFSFNLFDLLVLDWLVFCLWTPRFIVVPGTEGHPAYKDYSFHFRGFLKGTIIVSVMSGVFAGIAVLF